MQSFEELYKKYSPLVDSMANRFVLKFNLSESDFDDLRQEAVIALYNAAESYVDNENVKFGLYAKICMKNRLTSYIRSSYGLITSKEISLSEIDNEESREKTPEQIAIDKDDLESVFRELKVSLTPYEYDVFNLYVQGFSYSDIATLLSKSAKSVDNAIHRIKNKLKKISF